MANDIKVGAAGVGKKYVGATEVQLNQSTNVIESYTPSPPVIDANDANNTISASHTLGTSEIVYSEGNSSFVPYPGTIQVGNVARAAGYFKFKIRSATNRTESAVVSSPAFTSTASNITPTAPALMQDDVANTISASHPNYPDSELEVMGADTFYVPYSGQISVGNVAQPAGYWKFRVKAATGRNAGQVASSAPFTVAATTVTPPPPSVVGNDVNDTLDASSSYGSSEIFYSENGGPFIPYAGQIQVGNVARNAGYWQFKVRSGTNRNESASAPSPAFTVNVPTSTPNTYILSSASTVSGGIYRQSDGVLVRTLFSGIKKGAGSYPVKWDGTDDNLQALPVDNYIVKILSHNTVYEWQGVLGNTSLNLAEATRHKALEAANNMIIVGSKAYYTVGYNEGGASHAAFDLNSPQVKIDYFKDFINQTTDYVCTDGTYIYWTAWDNYNDANSFIYATKVSDNSLVNFSSGVPYKVINGYNFTSVVDFKNVHAKPSGIAVSSAYIFISYSALGYVTVLNKSTGAFARNIVLTTPTCMAVDGSNIWIATGTNTLQQFAINTDGTISGSLRSIIGLSLPVDVRVNGTTLLVTDGGTSQQIKAFNTNTGASLWTLGQLGGITVSPVIANDRFAFWKLRDTTGIKESFGCTAFAPDGSFWICDPSNRRMLHYSAARAFIENIIYQGKTYTCYVNPNNHSRVIGNLIEFQVDYSTANIQNAWIQKYNWEGKFNSAYNVQEGIRDFTTLPNGKTYALINNNSTSQLELIELDPSTGIRYQGIALSEAKKMYANGDIYNISGTAINETQVWKKRTFLGTYDAQGWPNYSANTQILTNSQTAMKDARLSGAKILPWEVTSGNILVNFRGNREDNEVPGSYHLRGLNPNTGAVLWQASPSNHYEYEGVFPSDGVFDAGQHDVQYRGNVATAIDRSIIWGYNGEFWKASQTNKWNHYYDNGLFIGQFGVTGPEFKADPVANAPMAGNSFAPFVIKEGSDYYLYHNDESYYSGIHRWKITGISSIKEQIVTLSSSFNRTAEQTISGTDLMANIPFNTELSGAVAGWTPSLNFNGSTWRGRSNVNSYDRRSTNDLYFVYTQPAIGTNTITRDLGNNSGLTSWELSGNVMFHGDHMPNNIGSSFFYFDVLDANSKIIVRFEHRIDYGVSPAAVTIYANNTAIATGESNLMRFLMSKLTGLKIAASTNLQVTYGNYSPVTVNKFDASALVGSPKTLRLTFTRINSENAYDKKMGVDKFIFNNTSSQMA